MVAAVVQPAAEGELFVAGEIAVAMPDLPQKADKVPHDRDTRFVPNADSCIAAFETNIKAFHFTSTISIQFAPLPTG